MSTNTFSRIFILLGVLTAAFISLSFVNRSAPRQAEPNSMIHPADAAAFPDFYQRHPEWKLIFRPIASIAMTGDTAFPDYAQRHPELSVAPVLGLGASDYFQRHSDLTARSAGASVDLTDYYFRHSEVRKLGRSMDLTDYFVRHPELSAQ